MSEVNRAMLLKMSGYESLPDDLPQPQDDGQARHLTGQLIPRGIILQSSEGGWIDLGKERGESVVFCYPLTGVSGHALPQDWDLIPGARGCTPELCAVRDDASSFEALGITIYGLSTQQPEYQKEMAKRLQLPYDILSDVNLLLTTALKLPSFEVEGETFLKRLTLVIEAGRIIRTYYPIFPPDTHPEQVLADLQQA